MGAHAGHWQLTTQGHLCLREDAGAMEMHGIWVPGCHDTLAVRVGWVGSRDLQPEVQPRQRLPQEELPGMLRRTPEGAAVAGRKSPGSRRTQVWTGRGAPVSGGCKQGQGDMATQR